MQPSCEHLISIPTRPAIAPVLAPDSTHVSKAAGPYAPQSVGGGPYGRRVTDPAAPNDEARRRAINDELARLEDRAMWSAQGQLEQSKTWRALNLWLGAPSAVAAAVSGALVLTSDSLNIVGGVLALVAAAGGAVLTTVNASYRANQASAAGNAYLEIQTAARQSHDVDLPWQVDLEIARQVLGELTARLDEQNKTADPISKRAYRHARRNIEGGGQTYRVDAVRGSDGSNA